jgi:hypothetical protein
MSWFSSLKAKFAPSQEVKEEEIQKVLQSYCLPHSENLLKDRISQVNLQGRFYSSPSILIRAKLNNYSRFTMSLPMPWKNVAFRN